MSTTHQTTQNSIDTLNILSDDALKLLTGLEIRALSEDQLRLLSPNQVATFSIAQLISLTKAQFLVFSQEQLSELNDSQKKILDRHQVNVYRSLDVFNTQEKTSKENLTTVQHQNIKTGFNTQVTADSSSISREERVKSISETLIKVGEFSKSEINPLDQSKTIADRVSQGNSIINGPIRANNSFGFEEGSFVLNESPRNKHNSSVTSFEHPFISESAFERSFSKPIELPQPVLVGDRLYGAKKTQVKANIERVYTPSIKSICLFWACVGLIATSDLLINAYSAENDPISIVWTNADKRSVTPDTSLPLLDKDRGTEVGGGNHFASIDGSSDSQSASFGLPIAATASSRVATTQDEDARLLASLALPPVSATAGSMSNTNSLGGIPSATSSPGKVSANTVLGVSSFAVSNLDTIQGTIRSDIAETSERSQLLKQIGSQEGKATGELVGSSNLNNSINSTALSAPNTKEVISNPTASATSQLTSASILSKVSKLTVVLADKFSKVVSLENSPSKISTVQAPKKLENSLQSIQAEKANLISQTAPVSLSENPSNSSITSTAGRGAVASNVNQPSSLSNVTNASLSPSSQTPSNLLIKIEDLTKGDAYEPFLTLSAAPSVSKPIPSELSIRQAPIALTGNTSVNTNHLAKSANQVESVKETPTAATSSVARVVPLQKISKDLQTLSSSAATSIKSMLSRVEFSKLSKWMNSAQLTDIKVTNSNKSTKSDLEGSPAATLLDPALNSQASSGADQSAAFQTTSKVVAGKDTFQPLTVAVFDNRELTNKPTHSSIHLADSASLNTQLFTASQDVHGTLEAFNKDNKDSKELKDLKDSHATKVMAFASLSASTDNELSKSLGNDRSATQYVQPTPSFSPPNLAALTSNAPNSPNTSQLGSALTMPVSATTATSSVVTVSTASNAFAGSVGTSGLTGSAGSAGSAITTGAAKPISATLRLAQVIDLSADMPKDLPKVVSKVNQPDKYNSSSWTTMSPSNDLPPRVAALGEDLIAAVKQELPGSSSRGQAMPYEEFKLRVKEAVSASPDVGIVSSQVGQAKSVRAVALSGLLPQVSGSVNNGSRTVGRDPFLGTAAYTRNGAEYGITVSQLLFDFGSTLFGVKSGKARELASQELLNSKRSEQALNCINAFIELERAKAHMALAKQNASSRLAIVQLVKERSELGGGSRADIIRAESKYAESLSQISITETRLNAAESAYRAVFYSTSKVIVNGPLHEFPIDGLTKTAEELASSYPGLAQLARLREAADMDYNSAVSKALPSFSMVYSNNGAGYNANNVSPSTSSSILFQVKYDFYTGGADTARKQDAMFKSEQAKNEFESGMLQYQKVLSQTQAEIRNNEELMAARRASTNSAVDSMRAVREQFAFNRGSLLDLITVQESLLQAGNDLIDAKYDRALSRYRLLHLTSELDKIFDLNYKSSINAID